MKSNVADKELNECDPISGASTGNRFWNAEMGVGKFRLVAFTGIILIGWLLYGHTLSFPFQFDDEQYLTRNPLIKDLSTFAYFSDISSFAVMTSRMGLDPDLSFNFILRPLAYLTFHLNYVTDGLNPRGFRAVNIAVHCANAILVFLVLSQLLGRIPSRRTVTSFSLQLIPLTTALLFLVHPLQTESVTYIVQRFTSLGALFYLGTIWLYLLAGNAGSRLRSITLHCAALLALIAGMLTKETIFTAPFALLFLDLILLRTPLVKVVKRVWPYLLCLPIIPTLVLLTSSGANGGSTSLHSAMNIVNGSADPNYQYLYALTQPAVVLNYLGLIVCPAHLCIDPDFRLASSFFEAKVLGSILAIAGLIAGAWLCQRKLRDDARWSLLFGMVVFFFVALVVSSSIIPLPDLMAEHRCYLASFAALAALVCAADILRTRLLKFRVLKHAIPLGLAAWVIVLAAATMMRNEVWRTELDMWKDAVAKSPYKARPWENLGVCYFQEGNLDEATECLKKAIVVDPDYIRPYRQLGILRNIRGRYARSLEVSHAGLAISPNDFQILYNVGIAHCALGRLEEGIEALNKSVAVCDRYAPAHVSLGRVWHHVRRYDMALKHYQIAAELGSDDESVRTAIFHLEGLVPAKSIRK
jgi:tetratricopeptide (TPR) repeat protein